ncbi:cytochrome c biogenesis protein CcdA [Methanobacterium alkalithermotolerans]|uniref:Cytochrome c biogenesis protein CcdA n=1 Tax=Methanobacterium alkalithermotolerans TaxID=2731220 RepID=A0A8T8K9E1_9EURY|nr:cytochrome c biogenesis protein CcdA [Methanobacterium alkalithermotolerans]QUH23723.1 cytochrome c biogenesis protein CcdA [Methanobacterium alkalithermotolerans]RJS49709.1 MAG: hypothetical protein CIT03_00820 [Methanobacterium sp.]
MEIAPLISFLAGMASVASPCVLPVIPLLAGYVLTRNKKLEILFFVLGLSTIFLAVITLTLIFTAAVNYYLYYIRIIAALILIVMGVLFLSGKNVFNLSVNVSQNSKKGIFGSFIWGVIVSLAWASCYTPYLISLIAFSVSTGDTFFTALNLLSYVSGFFITLLSLGTLISFINITKLANYSRPIGLISGLLIISTGMYLLWLII